MFVKPRVSFILLHGSSKLWDVFNQLCLEVVTTDTAMWGHIQVYHNASDVVDWGSVQVHAEQLP